MKKLLMVAILLLGIGGAGAGYYLFYYKPQQEAANQRSSSVEKENVSHEVKEKDKPLIELKAEVLDYYVDAEKLGIREAAEMDAFVERYVYKGDEVHLMEKKHGWGRVSAYFVYEQGGPEVAEWIPLDGLVEEAPIITPEERKKTIQGYIAGSDDLVQFEDMFLNTTNKLLKDGTCSPGDFEELGGWVKSTKYKDRDVYFVYCGGIELANKIYLDVRTGEIFYK